MKSIILAAITVFVSFGAFADEPMTEAEKQTYMQQVSKEIRQSYWNRGFDQVSSRTLFYTKSDLDEYVKAENNQRYHEPLDSHEISDLYRCHYEPKCELYLIRLSGSYYSGWGEYSHFIFLDTMEPRHQAIVHLVYGE